MQNIFCSQMWGEGKGLGVGWDYYQWYFQRRDYCRTTELPVSCVSQIFKKHYM